ncbi:hypothetical protein AZF37_08185 [endosymbiont 'TC1' of Trimyema compressum]|uniref:tRNA1(Val) (adenine(37)-N6)-methyltransferase n=1 Tax=endosymbiont 'TC1' of Trimyema compressum TaxID=243899 RepID=UPI0007F12815|nr:methyltransferase [endosymbiont 'TC1' of Trimyema compressum]AMP21138.1 hypothetical protein AZF37_08185 [endosymbiont 'TC1' of Trimyema compressum]
MTRKKYLETINYSEHIYQWEEGYRFSVDALLISGFVNYEKREVCALDIGTGSGIIPLLLHKKYPHWIIDGVEIQEDLYYLTKENYKLNEIKGDLYFDDVNNLKNKDTYDLVIANPPFFKKEEGFLSPVEEIAIARHEVKNTMEALIKKAHFLLKSKGLFYVIYPSNRLGELCFQLEKYKLKPVVLKCIHSFIHKKSTMIMVAAKKGYRGGMTCLAPFILYDEFNIYSREAKELFERGEIK